MNRIRLIKKMTQLRILLAGFMLANIIGFSGFAIAGKGLSSPSPEDAQVYIISPKDGDKVKETFTIQFGLSGMGVAPAGIDKANTGHHHLLVNGKALPESGKPMGSEVKHFGAGQTEAEITLPKGKHTLQLVLGNHLHVPHEPPVVSKKITVIVK